VFDRRRAFFAFQGLLTVVLLLFFLYQRRQVDGWTLKFSSLALALLGSLLFINLAPAETLARLWAQAAIFVGDAVLASLTLHWTQEPQSDLYLAYFVIIFGSALTRNLLQSFLVALCASLFYVVSAWDSVLGLPHDPEFWLRIPFLWTMASLAALLSQDTKREQKLQERRYQERLLQMERVAMLGEMSGEVAHQIKGPLTSILVNTDVLLSRRLGAARREVEEIQREVGRCRDILKNLLSWGRLADVVLRKTDLREAFDSALRSVEPRLRNAGVRLDAPAWEPAPVMADASLLHEAISGVLHNAVESMTPGGGTLTVRLRTVQRLPEGSEEGEPETYFELSVTDTGAGIEPENLQKIFQPFFTTKGTDGSGLGTSVTPRITQNHHGSLEVSSEGLGRGARFRFFIPRAAR
jgi:signal transduction histidine kinase